MEKFPAPASRKWVVRFKAELERVSETKKYWYRLVKCYPEQVLLDFIHDACGPESLMQKIKKLRETEMAQRNKLEKVAEELDQSISTLERLVRTLNVIDPVLAPTLFMPTASEIECAKLPEPRPSITFGQILMELHKYALALQHYRKNAAREQAKRAPVKQLTRGLELGILIDAFITCAGEGQWRQVADIVNAAYLAHGMENEYLTEGYAQRLWSRHKQRSPTASVRH